MSRIVRVMRKLGESGVILRVLSSDVQAMYTKSDAKVMENKF